MKYILCCSLFVGQVFAAEQRPVSSIWKLNEFGERVPAQVSTLQGRLEAPQELLLPSPFGRLQPAQTEGAPTADESAPLQSLEASAVPQMAEPEVPQIGAPAVRQTQGVASNKRQKRCPKFSAVEDRCIAWYIQNHPNDWEGCAEYLKQFGREATVDQVHNRFNLLSRRQFPVAPAVPQMAGQDVPQIGAPAARQTQGVALNKYQKRCPKFSIVDDVYIADYIQNHPKDWNGCAEYLKQFGREVTAHQVHDRFYHSVRNIRGNYTAVEFTPEIDALILESVKKFSHSWVQIAKLMPPFLPYQIMNRYNFLMRRNQNS